MLTNENFKIFPLFVNFQFSPNSKSDIGLKGQLRPIMPQVLALILTACVVEFVEVFVKKIKKRLIVNCIRI